MAFEDLRQGRLDVTPNYFSVDMPFYRAHLQDRLPERIIDIHTHAAALKVWQPGDPEPQDWPDRINRGCFMPVPNLLAALRLLFPGKEVAPVVLAYGTREDPDGPADYLRGELENYRHVYGFLNVLPEWSEGELVRRFRRGRFHGLKPYPTLAPSHIPPADVTIFDYLPPRHLKVAEEQGWLIMLHIPRADRLADPVNVAHLKRIADEYPALKVILAHVGRAYSPRIAEEGFAALGDTARFYWWDFSANSLQLAVEMLIEAVGPQRILYGSDLPITAARMRRIHEGDNYVNLMREADWEDSHTRLAPLDERESITFFIYEEIAAFLRAADAKGL
ncbi:MAG: amidohydrolase family protein, partial [Anaerolineae bacterium]